MRELQVIVEAWAALERQGVRAALATVVKVDGSSYRRAGARMLVAADGRTWGGISGGCLEADVVLRAQTARRENQAAIACYDTRSDADLYFGVGLGCNGVIHILIEPLPERGSTQLEFLSEFIEGRTAAAMATIFRSTAAALAIGTHSWVRHTSSAQSDGLDQILGATVLADMRMALDTGHSATQCYTTASGEVEVFIEALQPPPTLAIFGAGYDALPVAQGAKGLGWRVTVADHRPAYATSERFPTADAVILATAPSAIERAALDERTCALLMTHNYLHDLELLPYLLLSPARYIGVLGPQRRAERLLSDLHKQGWTFSEAQLARLHAPVGLDIGAETPAEIALSILAEMQSVLAGRSGGVLRARPGPIHNSTLDA